MAINGTVSKNGKVRKTAVPSEVAASLRYAISQRLRKRIEECFGWGKTVAGLARLKVRGLDRSAPCSSSMLLPTILFACPSSWLRRANCFRRRKEEAKMTQRRGRFLMMSSSEAKNFAPARPLAEAQ